MGSLFTSQTPLSIAQGGVQGPVAPSPVAPQAAPEPIMPVPSMDAQVGNTAPAPVAAPPARATISDAGAIRDSRRLDQAADQVAADEQRMRDQAQAKQIAAEQAQVAAQQQQAYAQAPALKFEADQQEALRSAQQKVLDEYQAQARSFQTDDEALSQQIERHVAASHPTDIWGAAGVNPILGRIAIALSGWDGKGNNAMNMITNMAAIRANQFNEEGTALGQKASFLGQRAARAAQIYGDATNGNDKISSLLVKQVAAQVQQIANTYAGPQAQSKAQVLISQLLAKSAELDANAKNKALASKRTGVASRLNAAALLNSEMKEVTAKNDGNKTELAKQQEASVYAESAVKTLRRILETSAGANITNYGQARALLIQAAQDGIKAKNPGVRSANISPAMLQNEMKQMGAFGEGGYISGDRVKAYMDNIIHHRVTSDATFGTTMAKNLTDPDSDAREVMSDATPVDGE